MPTRIPLICEQCGASYEVAPYRVGQSRFCSASCRSRWTFIQHPITSHDHLIGNRHAVGSRPNAGAFRKGLKPWNKGTKGVMKPNAGSFPKGHTLNVPLADGTITKRTDKGGNPRNWIKIGGRWLPLAQHLWESTHGPIPRGMIVHHLDFVSDNDALDNLVALTRAEHVAVHNSNP